MQNTEHEVIPLPLSVSLWVDVRYSFIGALANVTFCETLDIQSNNSSLSLELSVCVCERG